MKNLILSLGLMFAATFALTNCAKNDEPTDAPVLNGPKYELFAAPADTRTTNDGLSTKWADGDQINVFHAVAGSTTYKNDKAFTIDDIESGHFTGTLAETLTDGTAYDWYLFYPYTSQIVTPANTSKGWVNVGATTQTQTGNNSMAHLAGKYCPMYAKVTEVTYPNPITATMNYLASVIAVNVTNDDEDAITVTDISFTAPEDIVGTYYINFAGEAVAYKASGNNYVSKTASLTVSDGTPLAKGESAKFYMLIKPFTAKANDKLSLTIKSNNDYCIRDLTLPNDVEFTAGRIKTLNIGFVASNEETISWNLSIDETKTADKNEISWENTVATMSCAKADATTDANNYYGGVNNRTSTRFYKGSKLTIAPKDGYIIKRVEFEATTESYAQALNNSTWTNATASYTSKLVTITPYRWNYCNVGYHK